VATEPGQTKGILTQGTSRVRELKKTNSASFVFGEEETQPAKNTFNEGKLMQAKNNLMMKKPMTASSDHYSR
jgi:hypothetical protein